MDPRKNDEKVDAVATFHDPVFFFFFLLFGARKRPLYNLSGTGVLGYFCRSIAMTMYELCNV